MIVSLYFISILFAFLYIFIITHILTGWQEIEEWQVSPQFKADTKITIIIPFRNEEEVLGQCLDSIIRNHYPKKLVEIIAVNDHSEDDSLLQIPASVKILHSSRIGKKAALAMGIEEAQGELIVTTDADCTVSTDWLNSIASYYEYTGKRMIVGMVAVDGQKNVLEYFQIMDTCGVMGLHASGIHNKTHYLANGANLIFEKSLYEEIKPYESNSDIASGDDVFFVTEVGQKMPEQIGFLKSKLTIVSTEAEKTWKALWKQRKRWASKTNRFSKGIYKWMTASIWILSLSILVNIALIPFTSGLSGFVALTQMFIKGIMDFLFLQNMCSYFDRRKVLKYFIPAFIVQTLYIFIAGLFALVGGKYSWKNRTVK